MSTCAHCSATNAEGARFCRGCGTDLEGPDPLIGQEVLGRYRVTALIGEGGMGRVYVAAQRVGTTTRKVAVKTLRAQLSADKQVARRFYREAETLVRLTHPNIIQFFDFGELTDGTLVLVMEHIEGRSLAAELAAGPLSPDRADRILAQICGALGEAHRQGIVHRDLKPDNILLTARGGQTVFVKVLDFGIAKLSASDDDKSTKLTQQGMMVGTPPYMSPEQFSGEGIDARSDIYSLGVIAYEMLAGKLPFMAKTPWEWASKHLTAEPDPLHIDAASGIAERQARAIRRSLSKSPQQRPATVDELLADFTGQTPVTLREAPRPGAQAAIAEASRPLPSLPVQAIAGSSSEAPWAVPESNRRSWLLVALGTLGLLGLAALGLAFRTISAPSSAAGLPPALPPLAPAAIAQPESPAAAAPPMERVPLPPASPQPPSASRSPDRRVQRARQAPGSGRTARVETQLPDLVSGQPRTSMAAASAPPPSVQGDVPTPTSATATAAAIAPSPSASAAPPPDLRERIARAESTLDDRLESSVAVYQAAARKYGEHAALAGLRHQIARRADAYLRRLIATNRCAQAQPLFRALKAIDAAPDPSRIFTGSCPAK